MTRRVFEGLFEIFEKRRAHFGLLDFADQVDVGMAVEKLKGAHVFDQGLTLEVVGVGLDGVKQAGGQLYRRFDVGGPQVFRHDGSRCPVLGADVGERRLDAGIRVVVDDGDRVESAEGLVVVGLGIDHDHFVVAVFFN